MQKIEKKIPKNEGHEDRIKRMYNDYYLLRRSICTLCIVCKNCKRQSKKIACEMPKSQEELCQFMSGIHHNVTISYNEEDCSLSVMDMSTNESVDIVGGHRSKHSYMNEDDKFRIKNLYDIMCSTLALYDNQLEIHNLNLFVELNNCSCCPNLNDNQSKAEDEEQQQQQH